MDNFSNFKIKDNSLNRIVVSQDNKIPSVMVGREKSATIGTFSKVFNFYLNQTKNDKLPQLKAWFMLKKQLSEEGFAPDKFETLIFNNFIDRDKYTWNQMSREQRIDWMKSNDISGININYIFPGANSPSGSEGYSVTDPNTGASAQYLNPSTSKEPYNFGSGYSMMNNKAIPKLQEKEDFLEKTNYFGFGEAGKQYWNQIKNEKLKDSQEPKFKQR